MMYKHAPLLVPMLHSCNIPHVHLNMLPCAWMAMPVMTDSPILCDSISMVISSEVALQFIQTLVVSSCGAAVHL